MWERVQGIWEHREETQRPLHETMCLAEAWLMRHAPGGSMPSRTLKHCKMQSRNAAPKMAILEAPCAQNAPGGSTMRLPEALLPRNPTWESSHFSGLTIREYSLKTPKFVGMTRLQHKVGTNLFCWSYEFLGSVFGRTDFSRILFFGPPFFFTDFVAGFFSSFLWEKVPRKILQENPRQNPPKFIQQKSQTHFCRGAGPRTLL